MLAAAVWLVLAATVFAPIDKHGNRLLELTVDSRAVGQKLGVNVIVPPHPGPRDHRSMLIVLHGRGGYEGTFNEVILETCPACTPRAGRRRPRRHDHGYWHNREGAAWDTYVVHEVIPMVERGASGSIRTASRSAASRWAASARSTSRSTIRAPSAP